MQKTFLGSNYVYEFKLFSLFDSQHSSKTQSIQTVFVFHLPAHVLQDASE